MSDAKVSPWEDGVEIELERGGQAVQVRAIRRRRHHCDFSSQFRDFTVGLIPEISPYVNPLAFTPAQSIQDSLCL